MKKSIDKKNASKGTAKASVIIDKRLDALSNTILFKKKLEKANRILAKAGLPA